MLWYVFTLERNQRAGRIHRVLAKAKEGARAHPPFLQDWEDFFYILRCIKF